MKSLYIGLYGAIWLYCLSPLIVVLLLGFSTGDNPSVLEIIGVFCVAHLYFEYIWKPVRVKFRTIDNEFIRRMGL